MAEPRKTIPKLLLASLLVVVIYYSFFEFRCLLAGPKLIIMTPEDGQTVDSSLISVSGKAERISKIHLNDRQIFTDIDGVFTEPLLLSPGYNIIKVQVDDQFGHKIEKQLSVVLK